MQNILTGLTSENLSRALCEHGMKRPLLVCDSAFRFLGVQELFDHADADFFPFDAFTPNPLYEQVLEGLSVFSEHACDGIVAIGGGSAIDVAKCIKLYRAMDPNVPYIEQKFCESSVPLIAIPTTAGTGSESTRHAVIYYKGKKQSVSHESLVPNTAILAPTLLKTLPDYQKRCTLMDALCQAIESHWSVSSTEESREYAKQAIRLILANLHEYLFDFSLSAAEGILRGANFAGRAINLTATTAAHAMSYKLSALYGLPHGHAVAVCLPNIWEHMLTHTDDCADARGKEHFSQMLFEIAETMGDATPEDALKHFRFLLALLKLGAPQGKDPSELETLTASVNPERLKNNPVTLSSDTLFSLYREIVTF